MLTNRVSMSITHPDRILPATSIAKHPRRGAYGLADDPRYPIIDLYWKNAFSPRAC